jgi:glycosyltransferase involved in cell wall biosynthesis
MKAFFLTCVAVVLAAVPRPPPLKAVNGSYSTSDLHIHWMAPFFSQSGYGSEAIDFALGLDNLNQSLTIQQHGDGISAIFASQYPEYLSMRLSKLNGPAFGKSYNKKLITVCHSEPGAWKLSKSLSNRFETSACPLENPKSDFNVGRTMFETDRLPLGWSDRLNAMDEVWVPTRFSAAVFIKHGVAPDKVVVIPEAVQTDVFNPALWTRDSAIPEQAALMRQVEEQYIPKRTCEAGEVPGKSASCPFRFLSIGKWERRKSFDILLLSYINEFWNITATGEDPTFVELYIVTTPFHFKVTLYEQLQTQLNKVKCPDAPADQDEEEEEGFVTPKETGEVDIDLMKVKSKLVKNTVSEYSQCVPPEFITKTMKKSIKIFQDIPKTVYPGIFASVDAFVLPSRGEGWGRPHVEAMSMELPIIATEWSGPTEFMKRDNNSYPLKYTKLAPIPTGSFNGHLQAEPDIDDLRRLMRHVIDNPEEAKAYGQQARKDMKKHYNPTKIAKIIVNHLKVVGKKLYEKENAVTVQDSSSSSAEENAKEL